MRPFHAHIAALLLLTAACSGRTSNVPTAPAPTPRPVVPTTTTPPRPLSGTVHAIDGSPLAGVQITTANHSTVTDASGSFALTVTETVVVFQRADYETREMGLTRSDTPATLDVAMQPVIVLPDRTPAASSLSSADLAYWVGDSYDSDYCQPCKVIRMRTVGALVRVTLRWSGEASLQLWARGVPAESSGASEQTLVVRTVPSFDTLLYVGIPFTLRTPPQPVAAPVAFELVVTKPESGAP